MNRFWNRAGIVVGCLLIMAWCLLPIVWIISLSFKSEAAITNGSPGFFPAEQNRKVLDESRVLDILRQTPASRFGDAHELIGATLLLASAKAGSFITGIELVVDGGFNAMTI